jgi:DNA modification methylase
VTLTNYSPVILDSPPEAAGESAPFPMETNIIICGDNIEALPKHVSDESVDLIYIDPPFNSNRKYEVFWGERAERRSFEDRHKSVAAYLDFMEPRVRQLYRCLKPTGSFYYHCDPHAGHYIKVMLDGIFGIEQFQNEIVWKRTSTHNDASRAGRIHDTIFFYTKSDRYTWNHVYQPYDPQYVESYYRYQEPNGRRFMSDNLSGPGKGVPIIFGERGAIPPPRNRMWMYDQKGTDRLLAEDRIYFTRNGVPRLKKYLDESKGMPLQDMWTDIQALRSWHREKLTYPTQKPRALLDRIIRASSNPGDVVLDAFCGCGTTLESSAILHRQWIGIDSSPTACRVMSARLERRLGLTPGREFHLRDMTKTIEELRIMPPFEFENWAVLALEGTPNRVKTGDLGIDGRIYPAHLEKTRDKKGKQPALFDADQYWVPIQVKQKDKVGRPDIDLFETAMRRDKRVRGVFVAFGFGPGAIREIERAEREDGLQVVPLTVSDLLAFERAA